MGNGCNSVGSGKGILEYNVVLGNSVVLGSYWLSVSEKMFLLMILAKVDQSKALPEDWQTVSVTEYMKVRNVCYNTALESLYYVYEKLFERTIKLAMPDGSSEEHRWIISKRWDNINKELSIKWHPVIASHLSELTHYSTLCLKDCAEFTSIYTYRLYQLLVGHRYKGKSGTIAISVEEFLFMIASKDTYREYKYLNKYVIQPSIKELMEREVCSVELETLRLGRKVVELRFNYVWK